MSKVRDIIEQADGSYCQVGERGVLVYDDDALRFITAFDPEHVALMEAVVEAGTILYLYGKPHQALYDALDALGNYRREHGLV